MPGILPALFLCTLSIARILGCRTNEGADVKLGEGSRIFHPLKARSIVGVRAEGICAILENGTLGCFDGNGKRHTLRTPSGRETEASALEGAAFAHGRACALGAAGVLRCFDLGAKEREFEADGRYLTFTGVTHFALEANLLCVSGKALPLTCFAFEENEEKEKKEGKDGGRVPAILLTSETGRALELSDRESSDFRVDDGLICFQRKPAGLACHEPSGKRLVFKDTVGFKTTLDAANGFAFSQRTVCAIGAAGAIACHLREGGLPLEFKDKLGFRDKLPAASAILARGDAVCVSPRLARAPLACWNKETRIEFKNALGRRFAPGEEAPLSRVSLDDSLLCGTAPNGLLACWNVSGEGTGNAIEFKGTLGFRSEPDAANGYSLGPTGLCTVSSQGELRCFSRAGEEKTLLDPMVAGGNLKVTLTGLDQVRLANAEH